MGVPAPPPQDIVRPCPHHSLARNPETPTNVIIMPNNPFYAISRSFYSHFLFKRRQKTGLKITLNAPQVGVSVAGRQRVEAGLDARRAPVLVPPLPLPPSAIDRCGGEGGSADVAVESCSAASESSRAEEEGKPGY